MAVLSFIFSILAGIILVAFIPFSIYKTQYTKKNGIEAEAIVTRIEEDTLSDAIDYDYYVRYTTAEGKAQEARIKNPGPGLLRVGYRIRIKYLPEKPDVAVWIKERKGR